MENRIRNKRVVTLISLMMIFGLILSCVLINQSSFKKADALNAAGLTSATLVGGGKEMWNATDKEFDSDVVDDLVLKIFGDEDPDDYIDTHKSATVTAHSYDSDVVQASYINANIYKDDGTKTSNDYGLVVKLGGLNWMVTSITKDNTDDENIVCTLYLATAQTSMAWLPTYSNAIGYNAYCTSNLRYALTTDTSTATTWSLFRATGSDDGFAEQYLVKPNNINYQLYQNHKDMASGLGYTLPNEALDTPKGTVGWGSANYSSAYSTSWKLGSWPTAQVYTAWGDDYIWIPSATEVGWSNYNSTDNIWGLNNNQRTSDGVAWLRSGY